MEPVETKAAHPTGKPKHQGKKKKGGSHQKPGLPEPCAVFRGAREAALEALASERRDRSRAGGPDEWIVPLLDTINAKRHLYTASSCAGRLIVTLNPVGEKTGYAVPWLFVSHDYVEDAAAMMRAVSEALEKELASQPDAAYEVWFKLEPPILALVSSGEASAVKLMNLARGAAGIKRCFVVSMRPDAGHVLSVTDTRRMECLLYVNGRRIADDAYVEASVAVANRKLRESRDKMLRFAKAVEDNGEF